VKAPIDILGLSNGARSGLTGFVAGLARDSRAGRAQRHPQQPAARRVRHRPRAQRLGRPAAARQGKTVDEVLARAHRHGAGAALGTPDEFGALCAFVCSAQAGYITGQNLLTAAPIDGRRLPGARQRRPIRPPRDDDPVRRPFLGLSRPAAA
jgi:3-oxoacyl-[acyl-carrier protein] reductase